MKLTIIDTNFTASSKWMFKLRDKGGNTFYILNASFYRDLNLKSPITRNQLHCFYKGSVMEVNSDKIVTAVFEPVLA
jgi:hypothetical protein